MKRKQIHILALLFVITLQACSSATATSIAAPSASTNTSLPSTSTPTNLPSITPSPRVILTRTSTPLPSWVTNFAEPILAAIKDREPDFQDDFSSYTKKWYPFTYLGYDFDTTFVINNGVARLRGDMGITNYFFMSKPNIVLQIAILHPIVCCVAINLSSPPFNNDDRIQLVSNREWSVTSNKHNIGGEYSSVGQKTQIIIIVKDSRVAYYVEGIPVASFTNLKLLDDKKNQRNIFCPKTCYFDNVKFWNLDKIPNLP